MCPLCLLSEPNTMFVSFIHVVIYNYSLISLPYDILLYKYTTIYVSILLLMMFTTIINNAAMNILVYVC